VSEKKWKDKCHPVNTPKDWERGWCQDCRIHFRPTLPCCPICYLETIMSKGNVKKTIDNYDVKHSSEVVIK